MRLDRAFSGPARRSRHRRLRVDRATTRDADARRASARAPRRLRLRAIPTRRVLLARGRAVARPEPRDGGRRGAVSGPRSRRRRRRFSAVGPRCSIDGSRRAASIRPSRRRGRASAASRRASAAFAPRDRAVVDSRASSRVATSSVAVARRGRRFVAFGFSPAGWRPRPSLGPPDGNHRIIPPPAARR